MLQQVALQIVLPLVLLPLAASSIISKQPQQIFSNPADYDGTAFRIPTSYESAVMARRILHLSPLGTLSTTFPSTAAVQENRPSGLQGVPIGLMDYLADCEESGNPTILAISIATPFRNVAAGSNISLSLQWTPPFPPSSRISFLSSFLYSKPDPVPYSAANLPRFSLMGHLEQIPEHEVDALNLGKCFTKAHPDAKYWLPGSKIHHSEWVRLIVEDIYWVGGFGDRAYIGWIPVDEWRNVTMKQVDDMELPGERKGWKEW
jgi:hypothetical protein